MRWGFMGASRIGRRSLAPAVLECGHLINAVAARDVTRARAFADAVGATRAYGDYATLLDDPGIDAVYVSLTNDAHVAWAERALAAGKHVLCEKPLGMTEAEIARLEAAESGSGRRVMEAFCHVHHPQIARVLGLLAEGALGDVTAVQAVFGIPLQDPGDFRWEAALGGGVLLDLGTYCVSLMRLLLGEPGAVSAMRVMRGGVDATFSGQLDFGGVAGQFSASFVSAATQHMEVVGSRGTLLMDWPISTKGRETGLFLDGRAERFPAIDPYVRMVRHFERLVDGDIAAGFGLDWSRAQARVLDALAVAAREGRVVTVERGADVYKFV